MALVRAARSPPAPRDARPSGCRRRTRADRASAHGCSESRWPFIRAAASEQRKASASAIASAGVKPGYSLSRVRLAHLRRQDRVDHDDVRRRAACPANESASASVHASAAAFVARVGGVRPLRRLRLRATRRSRSARARSPRARRGRRASRASSVRTSSSCSQLVVAEVEALDRLAAAPAADQVQQPVDPPEPLDQRRAPAVAPPRRRAGRRRCTSSRSSAAPSRLERPRQPIASTSVSASVAPAVGEALRDAPGRGRRRRPRSRSRVRRARPSGRRHRRAARGAAAPAPAPASASAACRRG